MRMINLAAVAVLAILAASPAFAGEQRGGGRPGGGHQGGGGGCGSSCGGGGGHRPPPYTPPPPHGGGFNSNINVNVNANANASASAFAGASAGGYFNARAYDVGGIRRGGGSYGAVYVGGGGGDGGGCYGGCGGAIYNEEVYEGRTCASAPFGYVVNGFGRNGRRPPACVANTGVCRDGDDRGGRYGYSERRGCDGGGRREEYGYEQGSYSSYESHESYETYGGRCGGSCGGTPDVGIGDYERGYIDGRNSCGGCAPGGHDDDHGGDDYVPYPPPNQPEPPRYEPPAPPARPYRPERPRPSQPPRQHYSQEPGERG